MKEQLFIYLISQNWSNGYDTYDSAVVIAKDEEGARNTPPAQYQDFTCGGAWCDPRHVEVELIGMAIEGSEPGVVCASFNAG